MVFRLILVFMAGIFKALAITASCTHLPRIKTRTTMSGRSKNIPPWLEDSRSVSHVKYVLRTLAERESERASRRQAPLMQSQEHSDNYYSESAGCKNRWGNRYSDIKPYDRTRVIVGGGSQFEAEIADGYQGRYINASWVRELFGGKWWIATQAPLPYTAHAFLSVIRQPVTRPPQLLEPSPSASKTSRIRTVVQLTQNVESGRQKAHAYFPLVVGRSEILKPEPGVTRGEDLQVTLLETKNIPEVHCIESMVSIGPVSPKEGQEPVIFRHMMYTAWPDHGVPALEDRTGLLAFIRLVDQCNKDISDQQNIDDIDPDPPVMVNCSAGIGRTGSFIALCSLLRAHDLMSIDRVALTSPISVPPLPVSPLGPLPDNLQMDFVGREVDSLREQRPGMVQRDEQILLIYEVLTTGFKS